MKSKKRLLVAINSDFGKANTIGARFGHIVEYLSKKKEFEVTTIARANYKKEIKVLTPWYGSWPDRARRFLKMIHPSLVKEWGELVNLYFDRFAVKNLKKRPAFDIVHLQSSTPLLIKTLKDKGTKIVLDIPMTPSSNILEERRKVLDLVDHITSPSFFTESVLKYNRIKTPITVVPFGVNSERFKPMTEKVGGKVRFSFSGDLGKRKGTDYLLQAWKDLGLEDAELRLYGRIRSEIKGFLKDKERYNIRTYGFVDTAEELPKNDVFVFPSNREGSAKAIYEAMSCGLPVITTPNAGSVIRDGKEGFIIPPGDTEAIKEKVLYFYNNPEKIKEMGDNARKLAEEYTWERYAESIYKVYKKVLES